SRPGKRGREHQAIVIGTHQPGDLVASGSEHAEVRSTVIELIAIFFYRDYHSRAPGLRNDRRQLADRLVDAHPEFPRVEIRNYRGHSAKVVGVRMRNHDDVETIEASIPKIRRHHLLAEIEVGMHPLR